MLETTSQITFWRPCGENNVVNIQWHIACECEIMSIWGFCCVLIYIVFVWKPRGSKWEDKHASFVMGSCPAPIVDPHLAPHENYSNELSDLNVNLIPAGEPAHLITPLGV